MKNEQEINEGNIVIAEYFGWKYITEDNISPSFKGKTKLELPFWYCGKFHTVKDLMFHDNWNLLIAVIEKINKTQQKEGAVRDLLYTIQYLLAGGYGFSEHERVKIIMTQENLWSRVVEYIKWDNEQKK